MSKPKRPSRYSSTQQRLNAARIVERLPFHQRLSASQSLILKITPTWLDWCESQRSTRGSKHFTTASDTTLSTFENGILTLAISSTSTATLLKNQQTNLLSTLQNAGFNEVRQIRIRMALTKSSYRESLPQQGSSASSTNEQQSSAIRHKPQPSSIKSVEAVQRKIENEHLAQSLKRLAETLKKQ